MISSTPTVDPTLPPRRVYIVHGFGATPDDHWFPWLSGDLAARGVDAEVVALPIPDAPNAGAWRQALTTAIPHVDPATWIVAHSLGVISVLRRLAGLPEPWTLGGLIAVSGFTGRLQALPVLDAFLSEEPNLDKLAPRIARSHSIYSDNDTIVPPSASAALAAQLDSQIHIVPGGGHFLASDGFHTLPVVAEILEMTMSPAP